MGERLARLPSRTGAFPAPPPFDYSQPLVIDTSMIRQLLGYVDVLDEQNVMAELAAQACIDQRTNEGAAIQG